MRRSGWIVSRSGWGSRTWSGRGSSPGCTVRTIPPGADEGWLNVTAHCGAHGASVWATGEIVQRGGLAGWMENVGHPRRELAGTARIAPLEQNLEITLRVDRTGGIEMVIDITPDPRNQRHRFEFAIDQAYLPAFLRRGKKLLDRDPPPAWSRR